MGSAKLDNIGKDWKKMLPGLMSLDFYIVAFRWKHEIQHGSILSCFNGSGWWCKVWGISS